MTYTDTSRSISTNRPLWHNPMFWGIVGSLGMHMMFWIIAPFLTAGRRPTEAEIQRPVELVELSPAERERLPDFLNEEVVLPEIAPSSTFPEPQNRPLAPTPGRPPVRFSPTLPPFFVPPPPPPFPSNSRPSNTRTRRTIIEQPSPSPSIAPSPSPSASPSPTPSASPSPSPSDSDVLGGPVEAEGAVSTRPSTGVTPAPPRFERPNSSPTAESPRIAAIREEQREQPELFAFNEEGTTVEERAQADPEWFLSTLEFLGEDYDPAIYEPDSEELPLIEVAAPYPEEACIQQLEGTAVVGVIVNPDGTVLSEEGAEPTITQSSGYGFLNEQAKAIAQNYAFEEAERRLAYRMIVSFTPDPEVCEPYLASLENEQPNASPAPQEASE